MAAEHPPLVMEIVTDPAELARSKARGQRFERNRAWFQAHAQEIGENCRGKCICIAGEQLFVADTPEEALAGARAAHPDDDGYCLHYIYMERAASIYAHRRHLAPL